MTTVVSVAQGGTGSNSAALARTALGVPPSAAYDQANTARDQANTAYAQANSAYSDANTRLSASGGTLAGDLIITGNLTVSGNSTTLNTEILTVEDADVVLLSNVASTPALNAGIIVNRGTSTNTFLRWDEVTDKWGWSDDGSTTYKFTSALDAYAQANSAYGAANNRVLKAGDTMTGQLNISAGGLLVTGNVGFGTASPSRRLHLSSSGTDCGIRIDNTVSGRPALLLYDDSQNLTITNSSDTGYIGFINGTGAGTERLRISNTGNVGIGTTSPNSILEASCTTPVITASQSSTTVAADTLIGAFNAYSYDATINSKGGVGGIRIYSEATWNTGGTSSYLAFYTHGNSPNDNTLLGAVTERARINSSGNFGIGTTSPATTLHVDASGGGIVRVSRLGTGAGILQLEADGTDGTVTTTNTMKFVTNGSERMRLDTSGNLFLNAFSGRGGGSTGYLFKLNPGKVYLELMANNTTSTSDILFTDGASGAYGIVGYDHSNDSLRIYTNSSWQMTVNSSGYLGIGNTAPPRRLTVQSLGTGNYEMVVGWAAQSLSQNATMDVICTHDNLAFQVWDDNNYTTPRFVVERGGDVGIGTTNPTQKLDVVGNIKASGTMAANGTIDVAGDGGAGYVGSRIVLRTHNNYRGAGIFLVGETSAVSNNTFYIGTPYSDHSGGLYFRHTANNYQTDYQSSAYIAAGNTIMYMSPSGSVGIGTNSPSSKLHISGGHAITVVQTPGLYTVDTAGGATSIANGGTVDFSTASGMLIVNDWNNGAVTIYLCGGGSVTVVSSVIAQVGTVSYNSGVNGYTFTNNSGGTRTFGFFFVRTRSNA